MKTDFKIIQKNKFFFLHVHLHPQGFLLKKIPFFFQLIFTCA